MAKKVLPITLPWIDVTAHIALYFGTCFGLRAGYEQDLSDTLRLPLFCDTIYFSVVILPVTI